MLAPDVHELDGVLSPRAIGRALHVKVRGNALAGKQSIMTNHGRLYAQLYSQPASLQEGT
jgi:hypothetical protein